MSLDLSSLKGAVFSDDRAFRYVLWRIWSPERGLLLSIGLNPSTANERKDDPTVTRDIARAAKAGYGGLLKANLYAYVSSSPEALLGKFSYIVGQENDAYLKEMIALSARQVVCWGSFPAAKLRAPAVLKMIAEPYCYGVNADGEPKHPLYLPYVTPLEKYVLKEKPA